MPTTSTADSGKSVWADSVPQSVDLLVVAASWEPRFVLGVERLVQECAPSEILLLRFEEHHADTEGPTRKVTAIARKARISVDVCSLSYARPEKTWKTLRNQIAKRAGRDPNVLVDISTMPRETVWTLFHFLEHYVGRAAYTYHSPTTYTHDWLTHDPEPPRLVLQMSGRAKLGSPTALLVTAGFDGDRTIQLVRAFDPAITLVGLQVGAQFDNERSKVRNIRELTEEFGGSHLEFFELDAYSSDRGKHSMLKALRPHLTTHNVVMASLGPKLSAIPLYEVHQAHRETALVYAPARLFNKRYSRGIGLSYAGAFIRPSAANKSLLQT